MANPIRVGLVGIGRAGYSMHTGEIANKKDKFKYVAGCDILPERSQMFSEEFGAKAYTDFDEFLKDPDIELVDIATLSCNHFEHAKQALLAGKAVFLEKPFVLNTKEGRELIELARRPGSPALYIRHNRRFEHTFEMVSEIIDSGILGKVFEIKLTRNGFQRRNDWQVLAKYGGGQTNNWGPHIIDHSLRFCGGDYTELYSDLKHVVWLGDTDDHVKIIFKGVNGVTVDMEISGGAALPTPQYIVYGTRGALVSEPEGLKLRYLDPNVPLPYAEVCEEAWPIKGDYVPFSNPEVLTWCEEIRPYKEGDGTDRIWDALYATIREGKSFPITLEQSLQVMEVIEKVKRGTEFE